MSARAAFLVCALLCTCASAWQQAGQSVAEANAGTEAGANPIRKVVTLLQAMQKKVAAEGEREEELYDKFMCYCKTGKGSLQKSISESTAKVPALQSEIEEGESKKAQLEADVKEHQQDRADAKEAMSKATAIREKEAAEYAKTKAEFDANIAAMTKAIAAIEKGMVGGFLQTSGAAVLRRIIISAAQLSDFDRDLMSSFLADGSHQAYAPQSGEITGILKELLDTFKGDEAELTKNEQEAKATYESLMEAKTKEVAAATKAIEEKLGRIGDLGVSIVNMKSDLTDTEAALIDDQKFLGDMDANCAAKQKEYDERVKTRADELVAIADTIKILNDDDALELFKKTLPSPSLVQMTVPSTSRAVQTALALVQRAANLETKTGGRTPMGLLSLALGGKKVSFEKVIKMIDDMVALLKKEQFDDDSKKEYCDHQIDQAEDKVKELGQDVSDLDTSIQDMTGSIATLTEEIKTLGEGIAVLDKAVQEATGQRQDEHEEYVSMMASNTAAKDLLHFAKNRLNKFYNPKLYKAPPKRELSEEDRIATNMGGTMAPTAAPGGIAGTGVTVLIAAHEAPPPPPETWGQYQKKGQQSGGVLAMIDLLVADLDKEMTEATTQEKEAQKDYEKTMKDSAEKRVMDTKEITDKEGAKAGLEGDLTMAKEESASKGKEMMATEKYLGNLHGECDWLVQNFELRKEARAGEVDSLTQAKAVLSGADFSLVQTRKNPRLRRSF